MLPSLPSEEPPASWIRCPHSSPVRVQEASQRLPLGTCCSLAHRPMVWTWVQTPPSSGGDPFSFPYFWEALHRPFFC